MPGNSSDQDADLDAILGAGNGAGSENGATQAPPPSGADAASVDLSKEIEIRSGQKVKLQDLVAAYGRQGQLQRAMSEFQQLKPLLDAFKNDPDFLSDAMEEFKARQEGRTEQAGEDDPEARFKANPAQYLRERQDEMQRDMERKFELKELLSAKTSIMKRYNLSDADFQKVRQRLVQMGGCEGLQPEEAFEAAYQTLNYGKASQRVEEVTREQNQRISGIPSGRVSAEILRKPVIGPGGDKMAGRPGYNGMTEGEREAAGAAFLNGLMNGTVKP